AALWTEHAHTVAQILRAEPRALSQQEVADATSLRLSFGAEDAAFIDTDASLIFDPEGDDLREVLEFANTQLLEMRYLDRQLDEAIDRSYEVLSRRPPRLPRAGPAPLGAPAARRRDPVRAGHERPEARGGAVPRPRLLARLAPLSVLRMG